MAGTQTENADNQPLRQPICLDDLLSHRLRQKRVVVAGVQLERAYNKQLDECEDGSRRACDEARDTYAEMQQIIPSIPVEPDDR